MKRWLYAVVICIGLVGVLGWIKFSQIQAAMEFGASFPEPSETVVGATATEVSWQPIASASAEVVPTRAVQIINELPGTIVNVGFQSGAAVKPGQLLIELDTSTEKAELTAALARADLARRILARNQKLAGSQAVSEQANDTARADRDAADAESRRIQAIINKKTLRAPFAARAGLHRWEPGSYLAAGTEVTVLVGIDERVWVDFALPQDTVGLQTGDPFELETSDGQRFDALVAARDPYLSAGSRSIRYRGELAEPSLAAKPGALVRVIVPQGEPVAALQIPALAVREDAFGTHVFVINRAEDGADAAFRAERRPIELYQIRGTLAFVKSGLQADERVAAAGAFKLRDGLLVHIDESSASGDSP